jgi:hypothetical protein
LQSPATRIELIESPPAEVMAGAEVPVRIRVACAEGCEPRAQQLQVAGPDGEVSTGELTIAECGGEQTADIVLKIPPRVGEHTWHVSLAPQEAAGIRSEPAALTISLRAKAHDTSLAIWDIPSPVVAGERLTIKVGAKSSAACELAGRKIDVCDPTGAAVAHGVLNATPWPGTAALYWTEVEFPAPAQTGLCAWTVQFDPAELDLPHQGTSAQFSAAVVAHPEHRLTVTVIEQGTETPIADVQVRLGPYRGATDAAGAAEIAVPKGRYDINIWKVGFEAPARTVDIDADLAVAIEAAIVPEEDPDAIWKM